MWPEEAFYIIPRREWNAKPPKSVFGLARPAKNVIVTWTESDHCHDRTTCLKAMEDLQKEHMDKGMEDIGFSFVVGGDYIVYEGTGWHRIAMPVADYEELHETSILVGVVGKEGMVLNEEKYDIVEKLISFGKSIGVVREHINLFPLFDITQQYAKISSK